MGRTPQAVVELLHTEIPAKISRNKFCIQTGINQNSIDKYMAGIAEPTQASLEKMAAYFKKSVAELRGEGGGKTPERVVELLKKAIAKKGLSEVSAGTGLTITTVSVLAAGQGEVSSGTLQQLSRYFRKSVAWLKNEVDHKEMENVLKKYGSIVGEIRNQVPYEDWQRLFDALYYTADLDE